MMENELKNLQSKIMDLENKLNFTTPEEDDKPQPAKYSYQHREIEPIIRKPVSIGAKKRSSTSSNNRVKVEIDL